MSKPSPAEVLRFIAAEEPLERTLRRFPTITRADLAGLLEALARAAASREAAVASAAPPSPPPRARGREAGQHRVLRVYSDGAARGNPGPAGAGAVLTTPDGEVVERLGRYLGRNTNNYAEYMGLILGLERARELGAQEVHVFADSELLIRQLEGRYQVKAPNLRPLFARATALLRGFDRVRLAHVRRELNAEADEMSNRAIDERM
ncbi:MAG TPA: ribonuclease HI family protein [Vulgatibacter sp.]|nr:ribonuclease HI family protein [Vulgatibacter sp.]